MKTWILAARPKTLPAAVMPVWMGCELAYALEGAFDGVLAVCTLLSAACIQIATNFFNDAIDFRKGADSARRVGPRRVTASGLAAARQVLMAALIVVALACVFAIPLIAARGWPILAIGIPSLYFSYGYTGGPVPLVYRGLGELFVIAFFGLIAVTGTYFVQTGNWSLEALVGGVQAGCLSTVLIAVNNLRDIEEDRGTGKRTLAVRRGAGFARFEIFSLCVLPHLLGVFWIYRELTPAFAVPLAALVAGLLVIRGIINTAPGPEYNRFLALSAGQLVLFVVLFSVGLRI